MIAIIFAFVVVGLLILLAYLYPRRTSPSLIPTSVNYHFTRNCNYACGFCFHTNTNQFKLSEDDAKRGLRLLKEAGTRKVNFAGGEPFLYPEFMGELIRYLKEDLAMESVSIVTNGSKLRDAWFDQFGPYIDVLAVSCDSFNEDTNKQIGRLTGSSAHQLEHLDTARRLCEKHNIKFKINTVVNKLNWQEDMNEHIHRMRPTRWKVFQVLILEGENKGSDAKRDADKFAITSKQFDAFVQRHRDQSCIVPESNADMQNSYLLLDEEMRFLDCSRSGKTPSESILDVGVFEAIKCSGFDAQSFERRGGIYDWKSESCGSEPGADLEDLYKKKTK